MKKITLCADDFALSLSGSWRILNLIDLGRISAVSVMVQSSYWPHLAPELNARERSFDAGLHFNLTHPFDGNARPLSHWLLPGKIRRSLKSWLRDRLLEQIDLYTAHFHRLPDFIDGHEHVHAFRVVRDALFEAIALRWRKTPKPYLRAPDRLGHSGGSWLKAGVLKAACVGFSGEARRRGYATPDWFAGLYPLPGANFPQRMREWLANAPQDALLMCHPGDNETDDPIGRARSREYHYLSGPDFFDHCRENRTIITRFGADQGSVYRLG
jgi:predicted glycoside hydrolase/deacetylase ChbG (UPF0249 family)